jgi:hypothetical protein
MKLLKKTSINFHSKMMKFVVVHLLRKIKAQTVFIALENLTNV